MYNWKTCCVVRYLISDRCVTETLYHAENWKLNKLCESYYAVCCRVSEVQWTSHWEFVGTQFFLFLNSELNTSHSFRPLEIHWITIERVMGIPNNFVFQKLKISLRKWRSSILQRKANKYNGFRTEILAPWNTVFFFFCATNRALQKGNLS